MTAKNPRVNITIEKPLMKVISNLAKQEEKSVSRLVRELMIEAWERRADLILSEIANIRDYKKAKAIKHDDAWE